MAGFFYFVAQNTEIEVIDLLMSRYGSISELNWMDAEIFIELAIKANEERKNEMLHNQYCALLPYMYIKYLKYCTFKEYSEMCTGKNIDMRSTEEIMKEIDKAHGYI